MRHEKCLWGHLLIPNGILKCSGSTHDCDWKGKRQEKREKEVIIIVGF